MNDLYTIRYDGSNWLVHRQIERPEDQVRMAQDYGPFKDEYEEIYMLAVCHFGKTTGYLSRKELEDAVPFVHEKMCLRHPEEFEAGLLTLEDTRKNVERVYHMLLGRYKTFKRKIRNNPWNYFVTFTYDDTKYSSEESFERDLKMTLNHFAFNRGWRYIMKAERGEKGGRLHFHAIMFIPEGEMVGQILLEGQYSSKRGKYEYVHVNQFFKEKFGHNEFELIDQIKLREGGFRYLTKYISKDEGKFIYSRKVPVGFEDCPLELEDFLRYDEGEMVIVNRYVCYFVLNPDRFMMDPMTASFSAGEYIEVFNDAG